MVIFFTIAFFLVSAAPFIQSGTRALLINELINLKDSTLGHILFLAGIMVAASLVLTVFRIVQGYISSILFLILDRKFIFMVMKKRGEIEMAAREDAKTADLVTKAAEQGQWRVREFAYRQYFLIQNIFEALIAATILFLSSWWVFVLIFLGTIPELFVEAYFGKSNWGIWSAKAEYRRRFWDIEGHFRKLSQIQELKLFQNVHHFFNMARDLFVSFQNEAFKNERRKLVFQLLATIISQSAIAFAILWFVLEAVRGEMLIGTLTFVLASIADFRQALGGMFQNLAKQYEDNLFVTDLFKFLDLRNKLKIPEKGIVLNKKITPEIVFENVTFHYPGTQRAILKDFSLTIRAGEKLALVGINGVGKTTFVKLLCRFYDPDSGRITIGGHDIRDIDLDSWYYQLGIIFQDYARYHFLVKEAIAIGRTGQDTDVEKVKAAAKAAEADIFIEEWEKKYEQMLGREFTEGLEPSVGQWQKLALARTFYRDPNVLVLDEPTSAIDAEAEAKIFEKLESLPDDRTVILISHRFSTVRQADQIVIIENGSIKEQGTHAELIALNGTYARLFNLQAKGYK